MRFKEYFGPWNKSAKETLKDKAIKEQITKSIRIPELTLTKKIKSLDERLRWYAVEWAKISDKYNESGVYRDISEFIGNRDGLLIDLGCGNGRFLIDYGRVPAVGVDLNGYCLQLAEENIEQAGMPVKRYSDSVLSFNPRIGFDIKPLEAKLHLDSITLIIDDINNLEITKRILQEKGTKADIVTFMLWGGREIYWPLHFLDKDKGTFQDRSAFRLTKYGITKQLPEILKSGGRFYPAIRTNPVGEDLIQVSIENVFQDLVGDYGKLVRLQKFELPNAEPLNPKNFTGKLDDENIYNQFVKQLASHRNLTIGEVVLK